jgi:hypothetical protein
MNLFAFALNWSRKAVDELRIRPKFPATHVHAISRVDTKKVVLRERKISFYLILFYEYFQGGNGSWAWGKPPDRLDGDRCPVMHMFATATAQQVVALGQEPKIVETESAWSIGPSTLS